MRCILCFRGAPIARVTLDVGEPSGGIVEPMSGYEAAAAPFRLAGDLHRSTRSPSPLSPLRVPSSYPEAMRAAREALAELGLVTEAGTPVDAQRLDLWDAPSSGDPPFLLVFWGAAGAPVPAVVPPAPRRGGGARPAA